MPKLFLVYDARACGNQGTQDAQVMVSCNSLKEARSYRGDFGTMAAIYSYDTNDKELINEQWVEDLIE